jgi:hypothetical protein
MLVARLTNEEFEIVQGRVFDDAGSIYNPVPNALGTYCISEAEINATTVPDLLWVKELPLIEFVPPPSPPFPL